MKPEAFLQAYHRYYVIDNRGYESDAPPATKWFVVDGSTAEYEVNYPGELISEHDDKDAAQIGWAKAVLDLTERLSK